MKFFCEYCGNRIDAEIDDKCPNCGASYKRNKNFIKLQQEQEEEERVSEEFKNKVYNHVLGAFDTHKRIAKIPIIMFAIFFTIIIITMFNRITFKSGNSIFNSEKEVTVELNEYGQTKNYKAKVTKYETEKDIFKHAEEGYKLVKFHLVVENLSNEQLTREDVNCIVDGIAQENDFSSGYSTLPMFIQKGLTVKGEATFIVPKDATSYDIRYGDYITIHIEK